MSTELLSRLADHFDRVIPRRARLEVVAERINELGVTCTITIDKSTIDFYRVSLPQHELQSIIKEVKWQRGSNPTG